MEEETDAGQLWIGLINNAIGGMEHIIMLDYIIGFANRLAIYRVLSNKLKIPQDPDFNDLYDEIKKEYPIISAYFNKIEDEPLTPEVEALFENIFTKEYIEEMTEIGKRYSTQDSEELNEQEQIQLTPEKYYQSVVKFIMLSTMMDIKIIDTLNEYAENIDEIPLLSLTRREPLKLLSRIKRFIKGYTLEEVS